MKRSVGEMIDLRSAAASGLIDEVQFLLEYTKCSEEEKIFAYLEALENHHAEVAGILKAEIPEFDSKSSVIGTYAHLKGKNIAYAKLEVSSFEVDCDLEVWNAIKYGYVEMLKFFIAEGWRMHSEIQILGGYDAISWAARFQQKEVLKYLMTVKPYAQGVYTWDEDYGEFNIPYINSFSMLSKIKGLEGFKLLLSMLPDDNEKYTKMLITGVTCEFSLEAVKYLVLHGAQVRAFDDSAIINAAWKSGSIDLMKYLISLGADINAQNGIAIIKAVSQTAGDQCEMIEYMISRGAKLSNSALKHAVKNDYLASVLCLLKHGADPSYKNYKPLRSAIYSGGNECVKFLLQSQYYDLKSDPAKIIGIMQEDLFNDSEGVYYSTWSYVYSILQKQNIKLGFELPEKFLKYIALEAPHLVNINPMIHFYYHCEFYVKDFQKFRSSYLEMYYCVAECPTEVLNLILFQLFDLRTGLKDSYKALDLKYLTFDERVDVRIEGIESLIDKLWLAIIQANSEESRKKASESVKSQ